MTHSSACSSVMISCHTSVCVCYDAYHPRRNLSPNCQSMLGTLYPHRHTYPHISPHSPADAGCCLTPHPSHVHTFTHTALPTLDIAEGALNNLIDIYKSVLPQVWGRGGGTAAGVCLGGGCTASGVWEGGVLPQACGRGVYCLRYGGEGGVY